MWNFAHQFSAWLVTLQSSCSTCGSSNVSFSNICLFQPRKRSVVFSCGADPVELTLSGGSWGGSCRQWSRMLWLASVLSKWRNFIWTFPTPNTICVVKEQKRSCDQTRKRTSKDVKAKPHLMAYFFQLVLNSLNFLITSSSYKEFSLLCPMEKLCPMESWVFQLEHSFISPVSGSSNKNKLIFQFSCAACGQTSTKTILFQNIVLEPWYSPGMTVSSLHCLMNPPIIYSSISSNSTLNCYLISGHGM